MGLVKTISRSSVVRAPLCWLGAQYIRFVYATTRWEVVGGEVPAAFWDRGEPFILACWHGQILMMPMCWRRGIPFHMLISGHSDGQIIARVIGHLGIGNVAGSSTKGGSVALRALLKTLKSDISVGITPDAPRGPRMRASDGVVQVARLSGAKVIPCSVASSRRRLLHTWDGFAIAWPFARGVFVWGQPISVARHANDRDLAAARLAIEGAITAVCIEADIRVG